MTSPIRSLALALAMFVSPAAWAQDRPKPAPQEQAGLKVGEKAPKFTLKDQAGHEHVRIVVSGGFTADKIRRFEDEGVPVDAYGVGSSLLRGQNDFTADVVEVDGRPCAKVGREVWPNPRLERVT